MMSSDLYPFLKMAPYFMPKKNFDKIESIFEVRIILLNLGIVLCWKLGIYSNYCIFNLYNAKKLRSDGIVYFEKMLSEGLSEGYTERLADTYGTDKFLEQFGLKNTDSKTYTKQNEPTRPWSHSFNHMPR